MIHCNNSLLPLKKRSHFNIEVRPFIFLFQLQLQFQFLLLLRFTLVIDCLIISSDQMDRDVKQAHYRFY